MNSYIRKRLRADATTLVARGEVERLMVHKGLRGRFRELLVDSILSPWLPQYAACGTGSIVDSEDGVRDSTQDDIVVFDRSLVPPVLAHPNATEGVFPLDGVLLRIEVKSKLTRTEVRKTVLAAADILRMRFSPTSDRSATLPITVLFAFGSDLVGPPIDELQRLLDVVAECDLHYQAPSNDTPGPVAALCVAGRGCWTFGRMHTGESCWVQANMIEPGDEIIHFVGTTSNTCFLMHQNRQGTSDNPVKPVGGGIGLFVLGNDTYSIAPVQTPTSSGV